MSKMYLKARKMPDAVLDDLANDLMSPKMLRPLFLFGSIWRKPCKSGLKPLWEALVDRFNHQKLIFFPQARSDWHNLCFQDFKTVDEYVFEVCQILSILKFCGQISQEL